MDCTHIPEISCFYSDTIASHILNPSAHFEYEMILVTDGSAQVQIHERIRSNAEVCFLSAAWNSTSSAS